MVNCPKCGFSQPQDQYCASCGVDMLAYKPKEKPVFIRLISNTALQLSTISLVVLAFFLVIRHQQKLELAARISDIENSSSNEIIQRKAAPKKMELASSNSAATTGATETEQVAAEPTDSAVTTAAAVQVAAAAAPAIDSGSNPATSPVSAPSAAGPAPASVKPATTNSVRVSFDEVPRAFISDLGNDPDANAGTLGTIAYGVATDFANRSKNLSAIPNFHALDSTSPQTLGVGETTTVYRGPHDENAPVQLGVWVYIKLVRVDETGATLSVEVSRSLLDPGATGDLDVLTRLPLPETTVPKNGAMFISGLIPHRPAPLTPNEQRLYRNDPVLRVITSEAFHGGYTDLGIFVEPK